LKRSDAWKLFNKYFKDNEHVVIVDEFDKLFFGRMQTTEIGLSLEKTCGSKQFFYWDCIRFISHDGFPVKKLLGADGHETIELEEPVDEMIRSTARITPVSAIKTMVFSDPFLIENTSLELYQTHYPGNKVWVPEIEEVLVMQSKDGATGMLYELNHIYHFDKNGHKEK